MTLIRRFSQIFICIGLSFVLTSACGAKKDEGIGLDVAAQPANEVLMGPGPASTCIDRTSALTSSSVVGRSATGPVIQFNNFQFHWTSTTETLYIQELKWRVEGGGIKDGKFEGILGADELEALVGITGATIAPGDSGVINSNDASRLTSSKFAPCGLALGGIAIGGTKQSPFKARVTMQVIGTAVDKDGNQRLVRKTLVSNARYDGG